LPYVLNVGALRPSLQGGRKNEFSLAPDSTRVKEDMRAIMGISATCVAERER